MTSFCFFVQLADRTLILKQKEFFVFIIATRLLWNHSPSEWFSVYKKGGAIRRRPERSDVYFAFGRAMPVFLSVVRKKNSERSREAISAIGNANQMLRSTPVSDSR